MAKSILVEWVTVLIRMLEATAGGGCTEPGQEVVVRYGSVF